jgi:hypothetical protein
LGEVVAKTINPGFCEPISTRSGNSIQGHPKIYTVDPNAHPAGLSDNWTATTITTIQQKLFPDAPSIF